MILQRFNAELITSNINHIHGSTNFIIYKKGGGVTTNFLDLLLTGKERMNKDEIHHKPIYADTATNFFSNHPTEYKIAAHRYFITCMHLLLLSLEQKE